MIVAIEALLGRPKTNKGSGKFFFSGYKLKRKDFLLCVS